MKYRTLGKTGINVSEIGFGAWGIGGSMWLGSDDVTSIKALHHAVDLGINFFDTALAYGNGHSEQLVGRLLEEREGKLFVATKIPPKNYEWPAKKGVHYKEVFPKDYMVACTERSLSNLGTERIDLQQFHVWVDDWAGVDEIWTTVDRLKKDGKIFAFGISINDHDPSSAMEAAQSGHVDAFQIIYNIFDQSPEDELFPFCLEHQIGILARVPFDEGGVTGNITPETTFPDGDWRHRYFGGNRKQQVFERVEKLRKLLGEEAVSMTELALRFCLSHPAVSTVIPGMRIPSHVEGNAAVSDGRVLSTLLLNELKTHRWIRNFYG